MSTRQPRGIGGAGSAAGRDLRSASDGDLVRALARGRDEALAEAHRRHAASVRAVARRQLPCPDLAEEAVQDAFLQLWSSPERFDPQRGSLRAYLQIQAYRRAIDLCRAESSRKRRETQGAARRLVPAGLEEQVVDLTTAHQVRRAVAGLSPQERQAIELVYFAGHSYRQAALVLGQPEGRVKRRVRSGIHRLRSVMPEAAG